MRSRTRTAAPLALLAWLVAGGAAAQEPAPRTASVIGTGTVAATPDTAHIHAGVVHEGATAAEAVRAANASMKQVLDALGELGVARKDVQTQQFEVSPLYDDPHAREGRGRKEPRIVGYRVANRARVAVRDLEKLGVILDRLVSAGANELGGIAFSVDEPAALLDEARVRAVADARRKATLFAEAAGARLGRVLRIEEAGAPGPPIPFHRMAAMEAAQVPVAPGEVDLAASVTVTWELE